MAPDTRLHLRDFRPQPSGDRTSVAYLTSRGFLVTDHQEKRDLVRALRRKGVEPRRFLVTVREVPRGD